MSVPPAVLLHFATHHGIATTADLVDLGLGKGQIRYLVTSGMCERMRRNVYRFLGIPDSFEQRAAIACASGDRVSISHRPAGRLWGLRKCHTDSVDVLIDGRSHVVVPGAVVHRSHRIGAEDVVCRNDGIRVTSVPRTLFDLAKVLRDDTFESVVEQALRLQLTDLGELHSIGHRLREHGRDGSARFGRLFDGRQVTVKPVDSDLELVVERAMLRAGLPCPMRQHLFTLENATTIRVDFYWPEFALVLEVDHDEWHGSRQDRAVDKRRDRQLQRHGIHTVRVTDLDVATHLHEVISDLFAIIANRSRAS